MTSTWLHFRLAAIDLFDDHALRASERLGPYETLARFGAGGMGEVYKARDTRLHRIIAVKVSKVEFSERFERKARRVAGAESSAALPAVDYSNA